MSHILANFAVLKSDKKGVTALEYGLIAALIAVAIIGGVGALGTKINSTFSTVAASMPAGTK